MKKYVRTKLIFKAKPQRIAEIINQLQKDDEVICFDNIISLNGEKMLQKWNIEEKPEELDIIIYHEGSEVEYSFDTLKNVPLTIYEELSRRYIDTDMTINYAYEEYGENCGQYRKAPGSEKLVPQQIDDPFVFACDIWDIDPEQQMIEESINYYEE